MDQHTNSASHADTSQTYALLVGVDDYGTYDGTGGSNLRGSARKQFAALGIQGAANIVDRRTGTGRIRIGVERVDVRRQ